MKKTNIEQWTLNIERRMQKRIEQAYDLEERLLEIKTVIRWAKRDHYSMFIIGRSMLDVEKFQGAEHDIWRTVNMGMWWFYGSKGYRVRGVAWNAEKLQRAACRMLKAK